MTTVLKRKRSCIASSPADNTITPFQWQEGASRMPLFFPQSKPIDTTRHEVSRDWKVQAEMESPHLNSRTRKRHRDNRPDQEQVHASTVTRLFDAQKMQPNATPIPSQVQLPRPQQMHQKSTLHSFWQLPKHPAVSSQPDQMDTMADSAYTLTSTCDDCDGPLLSADAMDVDEGVLVEESACQTCSKHVCDMCSVVGDERRCLSCAT